MSNHFWSRVAFCLAAIAAVCMCSSITITCQSSFIAVDATALTTATALTADYSTTPFPTTYYRWSSARKYGLWVSCSELGVPSSWLPPFDSCAQISQVTDRCNSTRVTSNGYCMITCRRCFTKAVIIAKLRQLAGAPSGPGLGPVVLPAPPLKLPCRSVSIVSKPSGLANIQAQLAAVVVAFNAVLVDSIVVEIVDAFVATNAITNSNTYGRVIESVAVGQGTVSINVPISKLIPQGVYQVKLRVWMYSTGCLLNNIADSRVKAHAVQTSYLLVGSQYYWSPAIGPNPTLAQLAAQQAAQLAATLAAIKANNAALLAAATSQSAAAAAAAAAVAAAQAPAQPAQTTQTNKVVPVEGRIVSAAGQLSVSRAAISLTVIASFTIMIFAS